MQGDGITHNSALLIVPTIACFACPTSPRAGNTGLRCLFLAVSFLYLSHIDVPSIIRPVPHLSLVLCAISVLFFTMQRSSRQLLRALQTRPINSANPAISEIINKNPNEAKSAVIEAFLCGRCAGPLYGPCAHDLIIGNVFRIACQLAAALKFD